MPKKDYYQVSLKVILKNNQGEVLILRALDDGNTFAGFYDLPGGRIDDNEFNVSLTDILKRELNEEIGSIEVAINSTPVALGRAEVNNNKVRVIYILFEADYQGGEVNISEEHTAYKWVKLEDIKLEDYFVSGILDSIKMYLQYEKS